MDTRQNLIIANGSIITSDTVSCRYNSDTRKYDVVFKTGKAYSYNYNSIIWLIKPRELNPCDYRIVHNEKALVNISKIYVFEDGQRQYWHICFRKGYEQDYEKRSLRIATSNLLDAESRGVFDYLKRTAEIVSLSADDGTKILAKQYEKIDFIDGDSAFATYVNPELNPIKRTTTSVPIFPFGCNASQVTAVKRALENQFSVIQGPPGTGKTQTILNIIANLVAAGKTVQVVSNNNDATRNILAKLTEYRLDFIVAPLGNSENKTHFIKNQKNQYPDATKEWETEPITGMLSLKELVRHSEQLILIFRIQTNLASTRQKLHSLEVEYKHFQQYLIDTNQSTREIKVRRKIESRTAEALWEELQSFLDKRKTPSLFFKFKSRFIYGISDWSDYFKSTDQLVTLFQLLIYSTKRAELSEEIDGCDQFLTKHNPETLIKQTRDLSMQYLKEKLRTRYNFYSNRTPFSEEDLWKSPTAVQKEYPVILSTTFSARSSLGKNAEFDYVIFDEASQIDVATGALALSNAKNAVIVGDSQQLPNIITRENKDRLQAIFNEGNISQNYNFVENSFLRSICKALPSAPKTLLREHYRCHPKIIDFCNNKFYAGNLAIMTRDNGEADAISVIKTVVGNHERDRMNQRQIDVIRNEILPSLQYPFDAVGIITPYKNQANALLAALPEPRPEVATVYKFQGREKDVIILTTVDDKATAFSDDPNLLNVAVSRAKERLYLVVSGNDQPKNSNMRDLIDYVEYNNFEVTTSSTYSVFDFLYPHYENRRQAFLKRQKSISQYDSENLMYALIKDVLHGDDFSALNVVCHQPLHMLIRNRELMNEEERQYAMNSSTHLDFLIYSRIGKKPTLAIEVDGYRYHKKGSLQAKRDEKKDRILKLYGIPLLRCATNGSGEKEKIVTELKRIMSPGIVHNDETIREYVFQWSD